MGHQHIDTQVEFPVINQIRLSLIMLHDMTLVSGYIFRPSSYKYALTLTLILWFYNKSDSTATGFLLRDKIIQIEKFIGGDPCPREKVVFLRESLLQKLQVFGKIMFQGYQIHSWEMIDNLMRFHALQFFSREYFICPQDVPLIFLTRLFAPG